jgi:hypothetical protein
MKFIEISFKGVSSVQLRPIVMRMKMRMKVCTSLEEWAFRILKPKQQVQLSELVEIDSQTASQIETVHEENQQQFKITTTDFTSNTNNVEMGIDNLAELDTNTNRNKDLSFYKLALCVNKLIGKSLQKAQNRQKNTKKKL